jgi:hypothetical protein
MEFQKLNIEPQEKGFKRLLKSPQIRRTVLTSLIGALIGFLYLFFSEGNSLAALSTPEIVKSTLLGAGIGFFVSNSPCARNQC